MAGESFHLAKAGLHSVQAAKRFKMALPLTLESAGRLEKAEWRESHDQGCVL